MSEFLEIPEQVRPVPAEINPVQLEADLKTLTDKAIDCGAAEARIITSREVVFNPEILKKIEADDAFPSIHWPLHYPKDNLEEAVNAYRKGILFGVAVDADMPEYGGGPIENPHHRESYLRVYRIVSTLESICFYMGYHLAVGLAAGNCRSIFCHTEKRCLPILKGKPCIHPNKGRPSMEAAGIDPDAMMRQTGWEARPGGSLLAGLVMVA